MGLSALALLLAMLAAPGAAEAFFRPLAIGGEMPARVIRVQQYEDRMPVDDTAERGPRFVTLVEFEMESCEVLNDGDFHVRVEKKSSGMQHAVIAPVEALPACRNRKRIQRFTIGSSEVTPGKPMMIVNPILIENLPPVD